MSWRTSDPDAAETKRRKQRRFDEALSRLGCRNMNDTKWREVIGILKQPAIPELKANIKTIYGENYDYGILWNVVAGHRYVDGPPGPVAFHEIEYLELRGGALSEVIALLNSLGKLPIIHNLGALRIQGYGPLLAERS